MPVSQKASDTAENAAVGISKYPSPTQMRYHVIH